MDDALLERLYTEHHQQGKKYRKSVLERQRAHLFQSWIGQGKDVLDVGCRDGTLTRHLLDGNRVVGADIDADALEVARKDYGMEVRRLNLNAALPFPQASFDVVVLAETLEHLPYPRITLAEIHRILRADGLFMGNVPLAYHLNNRWRVICGKRLDADPTLVQYFSYGSLKEVLQQLFKIDLIMPLRGQFLAKYSMRLFARNVAWLCRKA
jgi:SAM-dependent methyltransferase